MVSRSVVLIGSLVVLLALIHEGTSEGEIKCFTCDICDEDKLDKLPAGKCNEGEVCFKKEGIKNGEGSGIFSRGCVKSDPDPCKDVKIGFCDTCDSDECNSASIVTSSVVMFSIAALVLKAVY